MVQKVLQINVVLKLSGQSQFLKNWRSSSSSKSINTIVYSTTYNLEIPHFLKNHNHFSTLLHVCAKVCRLVLILHFRLQSKKDGEFQSCKSRVVLDLQLQNAKRGLPPSIGLLQQVFPIVALPFLVHEQDFYVLLLSLVKLF